MRKVILIALGLLLILFVYHVLSDRFTPYTSQARVEAFLARGGVAGVVEIEDGEVEIRRLEAFEGLGGRTGRRPRRLSRRRRVTKVAPGSRNQGSP